MTAASCTVFAPTRLHLGLIDCSDATARRFGGVGIALSEPNVQVHVSISSMPRSEVVGLEPDEDLAHAVRAAVISVTRDNPTVLIEFKQLPLRHVGLGTGTAARIAAVVGAAQVAGLDLPVSEMARTCQRGGTSGIGVNAVVAGGVIFDGGRVVEEDEPFLPSRYATPSRVPPVVTRLALPPQWTVSLLCPLGKATAGEDEHLFFLRELPVPELESLQTLSYAYHGIAPALLEGDLHAFACALRQIHSVGLKKRELVRQSDEVRNLLSRLQADDAVGAGMSSLGPLIYVVTEKCDHAANAYVRASAASAGVTVLPARAASGGYRIESPANDVL